MRGFGVAYPGASALNTTLLGPFNTNDRFSSANYVVSADIAGVVRRT